MMTSLLLALCGLLQISPTVGQQVRLVDGHAAYHGRLEIEIEGQWGTVCDDNFGVQEARVVCRQLGYNDLSQAHTDESVTTGSLSILLDDLGCTGEEENLLECSHSGVGTHNCWSSEQVGVSCAAPGGTGCLEQPPCAKEVSECPHNATEYVKVPHRLCPICRCASCPYEPPCPDNCKSGETEYYQDVYCERCRCVPQDLPDKIFEPNSISVALLIAVCVIALGIPLVCLVIVLIVRKKHNASNTKSRQTREKVAAPAVVDQWFGSDAAKNQPTKVTVTVG